MARNDLITLDEDKKWKNIVDFTEGGKRRGEKIEHILKALKLLNKT